MKRLITIMLSITLLALVSGCYFIKSGKQDKIAGTYELTRDVRVDEGGVVTDYIERQGKKVYLIIPETGTRGYYVFKSNDIPLYACEVELLFTYDTEKPNYISYVDFRKGGELEWKHFGVNSGTMVLNYNSPAIFKDYSLDVDYTRVSKDKSLDYVEDQLGELNVISYENYRYHGLHQVNWNRTEMYEKYQYFYVMLDTLTGKATAYYALKADGVDVVKEYSLTVNAGANQVIIGTETLTMTYLNALEVTRQETFGDEEAQGVTWSLRKTSEGSKVEDLIANSKI